MHFFDMKVKDDAITVFAVGVTSGAVMSELRNIGSDPDCVHVHLLDTFADISPFTTTIQNQACRGKLFICIYFTIHNYHTEAGM